MSCWVAPNLAADFWGLSLAEVLQLISSGRVKSCVDAGFSFVRLPELAVFGLRLPPEQRPPTFTTAPATTPPVASDVVALSEKPADDNLLTPAEREALAAERPTPLPAAPPAPPASHGDEDESEMGPPPDEDPNDNRIAGWREGRRRAATMRRPPPRGPAR